MKTQIKITIVAILLTPFLNSCFQDVFIYGNREVIEEERVIPEFEEISSSGSFDIYYEYSDSTSLTLNAESNIIPYVETYVTGNQLRISTPYNVNINPHEPIEVYVKGPYVKEIKLSGSGLISTDTIRTDDLYIKISGSGDIRSKFIGKNFESIISGSGRMYLYTDCRNVKTDIPGSGKIELEGYTDSADHNISGSGKIVAYDLETSDANIHISGSGNMYLYVLDKLTGSISGSGDVHYIGHPDINIKTPGSGDVINEN